MVIVLYEHISIVGERGQITIPKAIREKEGLKAQDRVVVKIENDRIVVEKTLSKQAKEKLMAEGYKKLAWLDKEIEEEWKYASKEADAMIDDY
ncbi:MAG: AbrB/MazE/SpoVT family DNA-binding domain-containing protein [Candidatus Micrarchaeota archaeon]